MGFTCKIAEKEYYKKWYQKNKEKKRKYYQENKEQNKKNSARYYQKDKEKIKKRVARRYQENKEAILARGKLYQEKNKEKIKKNKGKYYVENREKLLEYSKKYKKANKERVYEWARKYSQTDRGKAAVRAKCAIRRALKKKQSNPNTDKCKVKEIYKVWDDVKRKGYNVHVDHIIPIARGGDDHEDNLMIVDAAFNMKKRHKLNSEIDFYPEEEFQFLDLFLKEYLRMNLHLGE
jgi:hypothetical protein